VGLMNLESPDLVGLVEESPDMVDISIPDSVDLVNIWVLDSSDLVDVVSDELWVVELDVSLHCALTEQLVVIFILIASLEHGKMSSLFVLQLGSVRFLNG